MAGGGAIRMAHFATKRLKSWSEIAKLTEAKNCVFRGQTNASWTLSTSLERRCRLVGFNVKKAERFLIREFRRRYHHYSDSPPQLANTIEWLSIMQHHGTPTRLLDCTYSPLIACYFAVEAGSGASALWRIDAEWCLREAVRNAAALKAVSQVWDEADMVRVSEALMAAKRKPFVIPVNAFRLNPRLSVQQGAFLWCGSLAQSFEANLQSMAGWNRAKNVAKFIIPRALGQEALRQLYRANITRASLFPGLDGFAQALGVSWLPSSAKWVTWGVPDAPR
jgi:FRG domain